MLFLAVRKSLKIHFELDQSPAGMTFLFHCKRHIYLLPLQAIIMRSRLGNKVLFGEIEGSTWGFPGATPWRSQQPIMETSGAADEHISLGPEAVARDAHELHRLDCYNSRICTPAHIILDVPEA
jgi:hypothetical protein